MIFGCNIKKLKAFYLSSKDQNEISLGHKHLGIDFYSHGLFEPSSKRGRTANMKALLDTLRKKTVVGVTCWELKPPFIQRYGASNFHIWHRDGEVN